MTSFYWFSTVFFSPFFRFMWKQGTMSFECVLKCAKPCESSDNINQGKWDSLKSIAKNWSGLDKFGHVHTTTSWQDGPGNHYIHQSCYISISSSDKLEKARWRKNKENDFARCSSTEIPVQKALCDKESEGPSPKRLRSSVGGPLHDKTKCVWCMQGEDMRHPNRVRNKLFRINTQSAWRTFKRYTVLIEDEELRGRLTRLIESTSALSDPFANDIMYHHVCWMKHIHRADFKPDDAMHLQSVSLSEAKNLFFRHVDSVILLSVRSVHYSLF